MAHFTFNIHYSWCSITSFSFSWEAPTCKFKSQLWLDKHGWTLLCNLIFISLLKYSNQMNCAVICNSLWSIPFQPPTYNSKSLDLNQPSGVVGNIIITDNMHMIEQAETYYIGKLFVRHYACINHSGCINVIQVHFLQVIIALWWSSTFKYDHLVVIRRVLHLLCTDGNEIYFIFILFFI